MSVVQNHTSRISGTSSKKPPSETSFWKGFWFQTRPKIEKKWSRNRYKNQLDFSSGFLPIWAPFWSLRATLKSHIFQVFSDLLSPLGHLGSKRVSKVLQDTSGGRFFKNLAPFWGRFWKKIKDLKHNLPRFSNNF